MKKILMIATGGTIASKPTSDGLAPGMDSSGLLSYVPEIKKFCDVIRTVTYDETVVTFIIFPNCRRDFQPMFGCNVGTVDIENLHGIHIAEFLYFGHIKKGDLLRRKNSAEESKK